MKTRRTSRAPLRAVATLAAVALVAMAGRAGARPQEHPTETLTPGAQEQGLRGSVVAIDDAGNELRRESGHAFWYARWTGGNRWIEVTVTEGTYEVVVPIGANVEIDGFALGGCPAVPFESEFVVPASGIRDIRARKLKPLVLRVTGEDDGKDLTRVEVRACFGFYENASPEGVAGVETLYSAATSPLPLRAGSTFHMYWVRAPGYAWKRIILDEKAGGERRVELRPAGTLALTLRGGEFPDGTRIRLYGQESRPGVPAADVAAERGGATTIESLAPGRYEASAELGSPRSPTCLGKAEARVESGKAAAAEIPIDLTPLATPLVPLRGTIRLPATLTSESFSLRISRQERQAARGQDSVIVERKDMTAVPARSRLLAWDAGRVVPGRYLISGLGVEHRELVDVGPDGLVDLEIVVPEMARVVLRIRDKATGECVQPGRVSWLSGAEVRAGGAIHQLSATLDTGAFEFDAPSQRIEFWVRDPCYLIEREFADLHPGLNVVEIQATRVCGITIFLVGIDASERTSAGNLDIGLFRNGKRVASRRSSSSSTRRQFTLEEPGEYEVRFSDLEGFAPIPPRTVTLELGRTVELRVVFEKTR